MISTKTRNVFFETTVAFYVFLYLYTAVSKLKDLSAFSDAMEHSPVLSVYRSLLAGLIPGVEIALAILLIIPATRFVALIAATGLMGIFTLYVLYILLNGNKVPCTCGGIIEEMTWNSHLVFNSILFIVGILACFIKNDLIAINRRSRTPGK